MSEVEELKARIAELERERDELQERVCDECLDGRPDEFPNTYGWNHNRVEGWHACGCIEESGPYQQLLQRAEKAEAERDYLYKDLPAALDKERERAEKAEADYKECKYHYDLLLESYNREMENYALVEVERDDTRRLLSNCETHCGIQRIRAEKDEAESERIWERCAEIINSQKKLGGSIMSTILDRCIELIRSEREKWRK